MKSQFQPDFTKNFFTRDSCRIKNKCSKITIQSPLNAKMFSIKGPMVSQHLLDLSKKLPRLFMQKRQLFEVKLVRTWLFPLCCSSLKSLEHCLRYFSNLAKHSRDKRENLSLKKLHNFKEVGFFGLQDLISRYNFPIFSWFIHNEVKELLSRRKAFKDVFDSDYFLVLTERKF